LGKLIFDLVLRRDKQGDQDLQSDLGNMREEIAQIDSDIFDLISSRMQVAQKIGAYKKANNITILQQKQWNSILDKAKAKSDDLGISEAFIVKYLQAIHDESIRQQQGVMNEKK